MIGKKLIELMQQLLLMFRMQKMKIDFNDLKQRKTVALYCRKIIISIIKRNNIKEQ